MEIESIVSAPTTPDIERLHTQEKEINEILDMIDKSIRKYTKRITEALTKTEQKALSERIKMLKVQYDEKYHHLEVIRREIHQLKYGKKFSELVNGEKKGGLDSVVVDDTGSYTREEYEELIALIG